MSLPPIYDDAELDELPLPVPVVHGMIDEGEISFIYGPWQSGKSFIAIDLAAHIARGMTWFGRKTSERPVLYVVGEGGRGIRKRSKAWRLRHRRKSTRVDFMVGAIQIEDDEDALDKVLDDYGVLFIDTLHTCTAGMQENSETDMGAVMQVLRRLIENHPELTIIVVHHTGKDRARGMRGSSALPADADNTYECYAPSDDPHALIEFTNPKRKDDETIIPMSLKLTKVMLGDEDAMGKEISSCVIEEADDMDGPVIESAIILTLGKMGPLSTRDLEKNVTGHRKEEVSRTAKSLAAEGRITATRRGKATVYALESMSPSDHDADD